MGIDSRGKWVYFDFLSIPHSKVAGVTGSGKSVLMKWLLYALLRQQSDHVIAYVIDLKGGVTFAAWEHHPSVHGVYSSLKEAREVLENVEAEMQRRNDVARLLEYNFKPIPKWPHIVVLIDEGGEMAPKESVTEAERKLRQACMSALSSLARVGREPGIHVIYGTQRPDANTIPTNIRGQMEATFCFRVQTDSDSRIIIRHNGAEQLPDIPGRVIFQTPNREVVCQTPYLSKKFITRWLKSYWKPTDEAATAVIDVPSLSLPEGSSEWT